MMENFTSVLRVIVSLFSQAVLSDVTNEAHSDQASMLVVKQILDIFLAKVCVFA